MEPPGNPGRFRCRILGEAVQAATGLVTLRLAKRQRGQLPPLRRNPYTVSRGLFLLQAPVQVTHSEHPQSEKTQRCGFGNGLENVRTNRVIAAKADDVAVTIPP